MKQVIPSWAKFGERSFATVSPRRCPPTMSGTMAQPFYPRSGHPLAMRYENLEHTADVMIKAHGSTLKECFENAAFGMVDQIVDVSKVVPRERVDISVEGDSLEDLLYNFLSEVLFTFDAKGQVLGQFDATILKGRLSCQAWGERFDPEKHAPKQEIKAVTYHMLQVNEKEPSVTVLFDV